MKFGVRASEVRRAMYAWQSNKLCDCNTSYDRGLPRQYKKLRFRAPKNNVTAKLSAVSGCSRPNSLTPFYFSEVEVLQQASKNINPNMHSPKHVS